MAEIGERRRNIADFLRMGLKNTGEKHKDSKKCSVITAEEYEEIIKTFEWYLYQN